MKNRAKCKLCSTVIESFHATDLLQCKCGEISVYGGDALKCAAKDWGNFLRIDDEGNEIIIKVSELSTNQETQNNNDTKHIPSKKELLEMLHEMIKSVEGLPQHAMNAPITHYDYASLLILLAALFEADSCKDDI